MKTLTLVEKMFKVVEKKLQNPQVGEESLKSSIFGVFGQNFKMFKTIYQKDEEKEKSYLNYFNGSDILSDDQLFKSLLYFNLPYDIIVKD